MPDDDDLAGVVESRRRLFPNAPPTRTCKLCGVVYKNEAIECGLVLSTCSECRESWRPASKRKAKRPAPQQVVSEQVERKPLFLIDYDNPTHG